MHKLYVVKLDKDGTEGTFTTGEKGESRREETGSRTDAVVGGLQPAGAGAGRTKRLQKLARSRFTRSKTSVSVCARRPGCRLESEAASASVTAKDSRWREGSQSHRVVLRRQTGGTCPLDVATAGRTGCRIGHRRIDFPRDGAPVSQKNELKPWQKSMWCIPPKHNAEFVFHMENVLEVYQRLYNPRFPLICRDELSKQLTIEMQTPLTCPYGELPFCGGC